MPEDKMCFVIAPIGDAESDTRRRSDQILKHIIAPAAESCGYKTIRADQISEPGIITSQVIQHIVDDPLVIADLTGRNPNVFYELAIRHAIKKPLVQIIKKGEAIPFDVAGTRTVHVDHHDLDSVEDAKKEITKQIKATEKDAGKVDTPISAALDLKILRQSDNPEERSLADLVSAISDLRAGLLAIERRISDPSSLIPIEYFAHIVKNLRIEAPHIDAFIREYRMAAAKMMEILSLKNIDLKEKKRLIDHLERVDFMAARLIHRSE